MISLGSLIGALVLFVVVIAEKLYWHPALAIEYVIFTAILVTLIFFSHRSNIKRIINGTENKFNAKPNGETA